MRISLLLCHHFCGCYQQECGLVVRMWTVKTMSDPSNHYLPAALTQSDSERTGGISNFFTLLCSLHLHLLNDRQAASITSVQL